ncbi:exported protein of unknown function [Microbacterium sp. Nx66]|nr:exported protein of unknown function [Microbacterium sp. Nx66]
MRSRCGGTVSAAPRCSTRSACSCSVSSPRGWGWRWDPRSRSVLAKNGRGALLSLLIV